MKTWQIVLLVLGCVLGSILLIFGLRVYVANKVVNDILNDAEDSAKQRTAELIISQVEYSYELSRVKNNDYPTLKQVQSEYNGLYPQIKWESDYIIGSGDFKCDVKVVNNYLKVNCLGTETTTEMILSNEVVNNPTDDNKESNNESTADSDEYLANKITVDLVLSAVDIAYTTAYLENKGIQPTLEQVKDSFKSEVSKWESDYVIQTANFNCDVKVDNNNLKVNCLGKETDKEMILSN